MTDLTSTYLGLSLTGPVIASASPLTGRVETLRQLEAAGASAAVLPSLFEEELVNEELSMHEALEQGTNSFAESLDFFPHTDFYDIGPERHVRLVEEAKRALTIPVIASVNAAHPGSWKRYTTMMADAGADAIELNVYAMATDRSVGAADVETSYLEIIREVREAVRVPLAVKLSPFYSSVAHLSRQFDNEGIDGIVLFNRFYQPDFDIRGEVKLSKKLNLSTSEELPQRLRWVAALYGRLRASLAITGGIHTGDDVIKAVLAGADVVQVVSAIIQHGPKRLTVIRTEMEQWMGLHTPGTLDSIRGALSLQKVLNREHYDRVNYIGILRDAAMGIVERAAKK